MFWMTAKSCLRNTGSSANYVLHNVADLQRNAELVASFGTSEIKARGLARKTKSDTRDSLSGVYWSSGDTTTGVSVGGVRCDATT